MLTEILFVAVVLVVAVLMVVDVIRSPGESTHGHPEAAPHDVRPGTSDAARGGYPQTFPREPAGSAIPARTGAGMPAGTPIPAGAGPAMPARTATAMPAGTAVAATTAVAAGTAIPAAARDAGPARRPESVGVSAGASPQPLPVPSPAQDRSLPGPENGSLRARLVLLVIIPAVAVTAVAFCIVRIVSLLSSPMPGHDEAILSVLTIGAAVIVIAALWAVIALARSVLQPLHKLRAATLEMAGDGLPYAVRRMREANGGPVSSSLKPIDVNAPGEIGEIARAFDQVRKEMLRLTANEATVHGKLDEMYVNLSHRSQSLVERQIRLIENVTRGEQDTERLTSLSKLDHIASRMHRNSQNLLVLAGQDLPSGFSRPVALANVLNAAVSEVEGYERVMVEAQPDIAVRGAAVGDLAHLFAELTENATSFSAADMPVVISGRVLGTGGVLVEIADRGIGMTEKEMAYANWQLENPSAADINAAKWMGLFVVARLAARHGTRIRLRPGEPGGLTALVWLPDELLTHQGAASPVLTDLGSTRSAAAEPEATVDGGDAATGRMTTAARSAEFASARVSPQDAAAGSRLATDAGQRPGRAWSPGGMQPVSFAEQPAVSQAEQPAPQWVEQPAPQWAEQPAPQWAEQPAPQWAEQPAPQWAEQPAPPPAEQLAPPQAEQPTPPPAELITLQAEQPAPSGPSGAGQADAAAQDLAASSTPTRALGDETAPVEVIVPPAEDLARTGGSPIYTEVESVWFRSGRQAPGSPGRTAATESGWSSPADAGWQAAHTVDSPASGGSTAAGLPRRMPNANLIPGSIPNTPPPAAPNRSPAAVRDRLAGLQRGVSEGRAAAVEADDADGNDES
jgi:signal transduction histidine kinase